MSRVTAQNSDKNFIDGEIRYRELCFLERAGKIKNLKRREKIKLVKNQKDAIYIADFAYILDGKITFENLTAVE